jgi:hypothetical protein
MPQEYNLVPEVMPWEKTYWSAYHKINHKNAFEKVKIFKSPVDRPYTD